MSGIFDLAQVRRSFGRAASGYDEHAALQKEVQLRLQERLDDLPLDPARVLDVGCGTAHGTAKLRQRYRKAHIIALDLALPMLQAAKRQQTWRRPFARVCADAEVLPFQDSGFDLVHSNLCLQWCGQLETVLDEFRRMLKPRGLLLFSTFGPQTLHELRDAFGRVDRAPHVSRFLDIHQIGDAMLAAGFRDPVLERDVFTGQHADVLGLMRELRALGATNADTGRARGLTGKRHLAQVIEAYEIHRREGSLPATWEVVYAMAWAPEAGQPRRRGGAEIASFSIDQLRGSRRVRR